MVIKLVSLYTLLAKLYLARHPKISLCHFKGNSYCDSWFIYGIFVLPTSNYIAWNLILAWFILWHRHKETVQIRQKKKYSQNLANWHFLSAPGIRPKVEPPITSRTLEKAINKFLNTSSCEAEVHNTLYI